MNKIYYLESLRGIAALTVALFHFRSSSNSFLISNSFVQNGWVMVDFFFVLSGFVIAYNYLEKIKTFNNLFNFQIRRFLRLYPLHLLTLLLMLALEFSQYIKEFILSDIGKEAAFTNNNFVAFINNFFLTHAFFEDKLTFNNPSWSISTEFFTYFLFGFLILIIKNIRSLILMSLLIIIFSGYFIFEDLNITNRYAIFRCIHSFFLGFLAFYIFNLKKIHINNWFVYFIFIFTCCAVCFLQIIPSILLPSIFFLLIVSLVCSKGNIIKKILDYKILIFLGKISYGIYMIHYLIWVIIEQILKLFFITNSNDEYMLDPIVGTFVLITGLFIIIFLSNLLYNKIEMPFNKYKKNFNINKISK